MRSRKNGEGSYSVITIKGVKYQRYRFADGKQIYAKTATELKAKKEHYEQQLKEKDIIKSPDLTLSEVMMMWLKSKQKSLEPTTYDNYERSINKHYCNGKIGNYQIKSITPELMTTFFSGLAASYAQGTIALIKHVFTSTIKYAVAQKIISGFDIKKIEMPQRYDYKVPKRKIRIVTPDDVELLYHEAMARRKYNRCAYPIAYQMLVLIMYSGLRVGEATALRWDDIEKDYSAIHVNRTGERIVRRNEKGDVQEGEYKTHMVSKRPKTDHSYRTIPLPQRARDLLKEIDETTEHTPDGLVFKYKGDMLRYNNISNALKRLIQHSGCERDDYTIHGLRHTYGSLLIRKGVDIKIVSELLGHSDVAFTYNVYIGVLKEDKIKAVEVLNNLF